MPQALRHSRIEIVRNDDFSLAVELAPFVEGPFGFETFWQDDLVVDSVGGCVVAKFLQFLFLPFGESDVAMRTIMPVGMRIFCSRRKLELYQLLRN